MKDNFSTQAAQYAKYRPRYPQPMINHILKHVEHRGRAWDCATGNGQAAVLFHQQFQQVDATDISAAQLANAEKKNNISYGLQQAEHTNFPENYFDLVTVAQALHWFHFDRFYDEVRKVAKNDAIIAAWCYSLSQIDEETDRITRDLHFNTLGAYWDPERAYVVD